MKINKMKYVDLPKREKLEALRAAELKIRDCYRKRFVKREMCLNELVKEAEGGNDMAKKKLLEC